MDTMVTVSAESLKKFDKKFISELIAGVWEEKQQPPWLYVEAFMEAEVMKTRTSFHQEISLAKAWLESMVQGSSSDQTFKTSLIMTYAELSKGNQQRQESRLTPDFLEAIRQLSVQADQDRREIAKTLMSTREVKDIAKDCKLPLFHGNQDEDVDDWLYMVDNYVITRKIPDQDILPMVSTLLRGNAMHALRKFQYDQPRDQYDWRIFATTKNQIRVIGRPTEVKVRAKILISKDGT